MSTKQIREAARDALQAHDALCEVNDNEPPCNEDGMPLDPASWTEWFDANKSAYARWSSAMDNLAAVLGEPGLSRHPFNFRPRCEDILAESATTREP